MPETRQSTARVAPASDTARQFVLKPGPNFKPRAHLLSSFPIAIWVERVPRKNFHCAKHETVYRVMEESVQLVLGITGTARSRGDGYYCVCDCMGHFIE